MCLLSNMEDIFNFVTSYTNISQYNDPNMTTENLMKSDVVEENLDYWDNDDFIINLPETIDRYDEIICGFRLEYLPECKGWYACYVTPFGDRIKETDIHETSIEALKQIYLMINNE